MTTKRGYTRGSMAQPDEGHTKTVLVVWYAKQNSQELHEKYKSPVDQAEE
jgi:hypothetical protein